MELLQVDYGLGCRKSDSVCPKMYECGSVTPGNLIRCGFKEMIPAHWGSTFPVRYAVSLHHVYVQFCYRDAPPSSCVQWPESVKRLMYASKVGAVHPSAALVSALFSSPQCGFVHLSNFGET